MGLDRHAKQERRTPEWLVKYGVWIVVAILGFIIILPFTVFGSRSIFGGAAPTPKGPPAQLTIVSGPARIWMEGSRTRLKSIQVKVGNRGTGEASAIEVLASIRGQLFTLQGPSTLPSGNIAQYAGPAEIAISDNETVQIVLRCAHCVQ